MRLPFSVQVDFVVMLGRRTHESTLSRLARSAAAMRVGLANRVDAGADARVRIGSIQDAGCQRSDGVGGGLKSARMGQPTPATTTVTVIIGLESYGPSPLLLAERSNSGLD
uniref:Uncharacterized protein n=1 Tax=Ralstonia solanacearum TaxID=305 RepID=A0A0S4UGR4_RALSL|nr:protein of unknown function [Ralstonia solanacearum]CUV32534.1 protein of unknown function [Ralstonia solanacearum]CUV42782.1 protein of unknown function [Ralstonia solanacearum]CUV62973.1 protein of unknown function [Ralstonia solanacearum]